MGASTKPPQIVIIRGPVGSGKTSVVEAIRSQMDDVSIVDFDSFKPCVDESYKAIASKGSFNGFSLSQDSKRLMVTQLDKVTIYDIEEVGFIPAGEILPSDMSLKIVEAYFTHDAGFECATIEEFVSSQAPVDPELMKIFRCSYFCG